MIEWVVVLLTEDTTQDGMFGVCPPDLDSTLKRRIELALDDLNCQVVSVDRV